MLYKFKCTKCKKTELRSISIEDYDNEKNKQLCTACGQPMARVIEWNGTASGYGDGWFGKSNGGKAI